jgi:2-iminobutanoate/2-iminopropanoate deaminase
MTADAPSPERGRKDVVSAPGMPAPLGPYSQAVRSGDLVFVSGQAAVGSEPGVPVGETFSDQARQAFANLLAVVEGAGSRAELVLSVTVMMHDLGDFADLNQIYAEVFPTDPPTRMTMQVGLAPGYLLSVACVAVVE